jgi:predicted restriction endonuclease
LWGAVLSRKYKVIILPASPEAQALMRLAGAVRAEGLYRDGREQNAALALRQGQPEFRSRLLAAYESQCAVTGCDAEQALEAAHINPYLGAHSNAVTNGLLLRADIHTLFDLGLLVIDTATMTVILTPSLADTTYVHLAGQPLRLPSEASCCPNLAALDEHRRKSGL